MQSGASIKSPGFAIGRRLQSAELHEFDLITNFANGYRNREDISILPAGTMVQGSQNVLTNTYRRLQSRQGYVLYGQPDTSGAPILSWFDVLPLADNGPEIHGRAGFLTTTNNGKAQFLYIANAGDNYKGTTFTQDQPYWIDLLTGLTSVDFNYATWSPVPLASPGFETAKLVLLVNGTNNLWAWTGAMATISAANDNSGVISQLSVDNTSPGINYVVGDVVTINGGTGGTATVFSVVDGGIVTASPKGGTGYTAGDLVTPFAVGATGGQLHVATVNGSGVPLTFTVVSPGQGYSTNVIYPLAGGTGTGGFVTFTALANGEVSSVNITNAGSGYSASTSETTTGGSGTGLKIDVLSTTQGQIILNGLSAIQQNFLSSNGYQQQVNINGNVYTYTQSYGNVLSGVTPDPSAEPTQSVIFQQPINYACNAITDYSLSTIDLISSINNQVFYGSLRDNTFYYSQNINFLSCAKTATTGTTQPLQGDGGSEVLDAPPTAFVPHLVTNVGNNGSNQSTMTIFAGESFYYNFNFNYGSVNVPNPSVSTETISIAIQTPVLSLTKLTRKEGAQSQKWTTTNKNDVIYLSYTPTINSFGLVDNLLGTQQISNLSFSIINDMNTYDFTNGSITFDKDFIYACIPQNGLIRIYNQTDQTTYLGDTPSTAQTAKNFYWEAPQTIPIAGISIINGGVYGHSYQSSETYQLFTGWRDRATSLGVGGNPIFAQATFAYNQYGVRFRPKQFQGLYIEGNITTNSILNIIVNYVLNKNGSRAIKKTFVGTSPNVLTISPMDGLGEMALGENPLGSTLEVQNPNGTPYPFRVVKVYQPIPFFEEQINFYSNQLDAQWQIVAYGTNAQTTAEGSNFIYE